MASDVLAVFVFFHVQGAPNLIAFSVKATHPSSVMSGFLAPVIMKILRQKKKQKKNRFSFDNKMDNSKSVLNNWYRFGTDFSVRTFVSVHCYIWYQAPFFGIKISEHRTISRIQLYHHNWVKKSKQKELPRADSPCVLLPSCCECFMNCMNYCAFLIASWCSAHV